MTAKERRDKIDKHKFESDNLVAGLKENGDAPPQPDIPDFPDIPEPGGP